jgi:hypothetical protein
MKSGLKARVEKLEAARRPKVPTVCHRLTVERGESEQDARQRYEQESDRVIGARDFCIMRIIIDPVDGMRA